MATETAATGRESDKFMLRFPEGMRAAIKDAAEKNGRTMNAEIIARLQASFDEELPDRTAEMLLHGELGATAKSLNNAMRHLALLSKRLQVEGADLVAAGLGRSTLKQPPKAEPVSLPELMERSGAKDLGQLGDKVAHALNPKPKASKKQPAE